MRRGVKIILAVLIVFISNILSYGQDNTGQIFNLNKLPTQDTLLSGWRFQPGDNPQWAKPGIDDSNWKFTDPGIDVTKFTQLKNAGVGWLRLHIKADSALARQQIWVWVSQYTASEIYLDGKLIQQYGHVTSNTAKTIALTPNRKPFALKLVAGQTHVIAVRLGYQSGVLYSSPEFTPLPAFSMYANTYQAEQDNTNNFLNTEQKLLVVNALSTGIFLIFCFIHLLYFIFDRSQKFNLYYLVYCFCIFLICASNTFISYQNHTEILSAYMWVFVWGGGSFCVGFLFLTLVVYELFGYKERRFFKILIALAIATMLTYAVDDVLNGICVSIIFPVLCMLEAARACFIVLKRRGKSLALVFFILLYIILFTWGGLLDQTTLLANMVNYFVFLGLPIGMSVYLGIKNASTNRELKLTLTEVRILSAQTLAQEQEKQQILASQNDLLEEQVMERTAELNQSIIHLKQTQTQLIQAEKMASLGELTAGIAHEIQNPLNFVNNFSEVSIELVDEMQSELKNGDKEEAIAISDDIKQNLEKIRHHGKRADGIVKGMLEHSRSGTGEKQPTDLNALADEFLKLSYHGLRAKDKNFNAEIISDFDFSLPKAGVSQQDIGRVLLNLFNNAFYAVNQKLKAADPSYQPTIQVTTFAPPLGGWGISVRDNGNGIPEAIRDKIMQPFFTTKPTGEGTGLGLSLSYDIVVKGHGGTITVDSRENEYTEFVITIPA